MKLSACFDSAQEKYLSIFIKPAAVPLSVARSHITYDESQVGGPHPAGGGGTFNYARLLAASATHDETATFALRQSPLSLKFIEYDR